MKKRGLAVFLAFLLLFGVGCNSQKTSVQFKSEELEQLVVYTSHTKEVYGPVIKEFQERTGIWVEVRQGGSSELIREIQQQQGEPVCDVLFGGSIELHQANREYFEAYRCSETEKLEQEFVNDENGWTVFSYLPLVIIYNTKLLEGSQTPKGWADLTNEAWKGRVAFANPELSGSCYTALATIVQVGGENGWENLCQFKENIEGEQLESSAKILEAVAGGEFAVGITLEEAALRLEEEGASIGIIYPIEGTSVVPDASSIINGAQNLENAKRFIDFTVSKDIQGMISMEFHRRPVRADINAPNGIAPLGEIMWRQYDFAWSSEHREDVLQRWAGQ